VSKKWQGRKPGPYEWYEIQDNIAYWEEFEEHKIVYPDIAKQAEFAWDMDSYYLVNTLYLMPTDKTWLLGLLNSKAVFWFYTKISTQIRGGFVRFIAQYVQQIPVPASDECNSIEQLVHDIIKARQKTSDADISGLEAQIDQYVYELYGLNKEEIALIEADSQQKPPEDNKHVLRESVIPALSGRHKYFSLDDVHKALAENEKTVDPKSLKQYMHELMDETVIYSAGRGWYSTIEQQFEVNTEPVSEIISVLEKKFPLLDFTCWSTMQINPFMHHLLGKFVTFVHVDRDLMPSVFDFLRDTDYEVYLNPTRREAQKSYSVSEQTIVIRPVITKAPVKNHTAKIEKILVDLYIERDILQIMDPAEFYEMADKLISAGRIAISELMSYAKYRKIKLKDIFKSSQYTISSMAPKRS